MDQQPQRPFLPGDSIIQTKLTVAAPRPAVVARPDLLARLDAGLRRPLTLIAAPAGFGKTTLLSMWRARLSDTATPLAWVTLEDDDNDPLRFWRYLVTALDLLQPGIAAHVSSFVQGFQPPSLRSLLPELLNALGTLSVDAALVLDDYHVIDSPAIHQMLTTLLDHLPPRLHLLIASRTDPPLPLARLRARHQLTEIRADDLRFGPDETALFLNDVMGLSLATAEVTALEARTEGWIAGLQLVALSMQRRADLPGFIAALRGSHRSILDYLVDEVIARQSEDVTAFLMHTAVLHRLTASLCNAVTEQSDGQAMLEALEGTNLFVVPLDDERRWYRYHHLFAEALAHRLEQTQRATCSYAARSAIR